MPASKDPRDCAEEEICHKLHSELVKWDFLTSALGMDDHAG